MNKLKRIALWGVVFVFGFLMISSQPALALSDWLMEKYSDYQVYFYNAEQKNCIERGDEGGDVPLVGSDRAEKIWRYIVGLGIDGLSNKPEAIAGILGNIHVESNFRPFIQSSSGYRGLIQWSSSSPLLNYMSSRNLSQYFHTGSEPPSLTEEIIDAGISAELNFLFNVPHGNSANLYISRLNIPTNKDGVAGARAYSDLFLVTVERAVGGSEGLEDPGVRAFIGRNDYQGAASRRAWAERYYNQFKNIMNSSGGSSGSSGTAGSNSLPYCDESDDSDDTGGGDYTGLIFYNQCDPKWGNLNYGPSGINGNDGIGTICNSGCGPTSFAVIAANLKKNTSITPKGTSDSAGKAGMHVPGAGSSWSITNFLATKYGLSATRIDGTVAAINEYLDNGYMIHTSGKGGAPFTPGGHYIAIVKKLDNGKWLVADSSRRGPSGEYDPATVMAGMNKNNVWAVK